MEIKSYNSKKNWLAIKYYFIKKYSKNFRKSLKVLDTYANSIFELHMPEEFYLPKNPLHFQNNNLYLHRYKEYFPNLIKFLSQIEVKNKLELIKELSKRLKIPIEEVENLLNTSGCKRILVTATMSAGKSTLVNALVGKKIMATRNESCTAKKYVVKEDTTCGNHVFCEYRNMKVRIKKDIAEILHNYNAEVLRIFTSMIHFGDKYFWEIIDTPGVNSSADPEHKKISEEVILSGNFDVLLYVMNGNHLGTNDDLQHLEFIKKNVDFKKIIFVINKVDQFRKNNDSIEDSIKNVKQQLEDIGFIQPIIQPISAYTGYLIKANQNKYILNDDENDEMDLLNRKFERPTFNLAAYNSTTLKENINDTHKKLKRCGLLNLEQLISGKEVSHG